MHIKNLKTPDEIADAFNTFLELRPHLTNKAVFVVQVIQQQKEDYEITVVIENDEIVACVGFRMMTMLAWGEILYIFITFIN